MAVLFSEDWMKDLAKAWNADKDMVSNLKKEGFDATIAYGFKGKVNPAGVLVVSNGQVTSAVSYDSQELDWDLRADIKDWERWITKGFGLVNLATSVTQGKLVFEQGDFRRMIRNTSLATPFLRHFELMSKIKTKY